MLFPTLLPRIRNRPAKPSPDPRPHKPIHAHPRRQREPNPKHPHQQATLLLHIPLDLAVALILETDARILRAPLPTGEIEIRALLDPLPDLVDGGPDARAHFLVVPQGEIVDRGRVGDALGRVGREGGFAGGGPRSGRRFAVHVVGVEGVEQDAHVFEAGVHALAVERDHGVGGVAEDYDGGFVVVGPAFDGYEW